ncbi:hypothetical protein DFQ28_008630 [Apophysomyces sp. BC1034]|nr:hypothetical protein DFQ30_008378 [Apophysomyces sp. BC1015]KAG0174774.1 hypothetical protein DFQ29_007359 [Apophysomyces sp. BC1021]KAG0185879.1 hypothetical protein DFQ28_008630 [Apophysomyces sp. BC1034]
MTDDAAIAQKLQKEENERFQQAKEMYDADLAFAQLLQQQELENKTSSTIDDPNPDLHELFLLFNDLYFEGRLGMVEVQWSKRMTLCAGLCYYKPGGLCTIRLSEPLLRFRTREDMINTLLVNYDCRSKAV